MVARCREVLLYIHIYIYIYIYICGFSLQVQDRKDKFESEQSDSWPTAWRRRGRENARPTVNITEVKVVRYKY